jgi:hypothetical protein
LHDEFSPLDKDKLMTVMAGTHYRLYALMGYAQQKPPPGDYYENLSAIVIAGLFSRRQRIAQYPA